jgi:hypothetical protein
VFDGAGVSWGGGLSDSGGCRVLKTVSQGNRIGAIWERGARARAWARVRDGKRVLWYAEIDAGPESIFRVRTSSAVRQMRIGGSEVGSVREVERDCDGRGKHAVHSSTQPYPSHSHVRITRFPKVT